MCNFSNTYKNFHYAIVIISIFRHFDKIENETVTGFPYSNFLIYVHSDIRTFSCVFYSQCNSYQTSHVIFLRLSYCE